jgi:hypothetical protein
LDALPQAALVGTCAPRALQRPTRLRGAPTLPTAESTRSSRRTANLGRTVRPNPIEPYATGRQSISWKASRTGRSCIGASARALPWSSEFALSSHTHPSRVLLPGAHRYNYGDLTTKWFVGDARTVLSECDHQERYLSSALNDPATGAKSGPPTEYSATMMPTKGGGYEKDASRGWRDHSAAKSGKHLHVGDLRVTAGELCPPSARFRSKEGL